MDNSFFDALSLLGSENNVDIAQLVEKVKSAMLKAARKAYPECEDNITVEIDPATKKFEMYVRQTVVDDEPIDANEVKLDVSIRVHDRTHNWEFADRFNRTFRLGPQSRTTVRVPLLEIERAPLGRRLDLQHVANFQLFTSGVNAGRELYVSRIWLE